MILIWSRVRSICAYLDKFPPPRSLSLEFVEDSISWADKEGRPLNSLKMPVEEIENIRSNVSCIITLFSSLTNIRPTIITLPKSLQGKQQISKLRDGRLGKINLQQPSGLDIGRVIERISSHIEDIRLDLQIDTGLASLRGFGEYYEQREVTSWKEHAELEKE